MRIFTTTGDFLNPTKTLFQGHDVQVLPKNYASLLADLIIFTGGEDINPKLYGGGDASGLDKDSRDAWEYEILRNIRRGKLVTKKVLGICRGLQFLNVGFGGSLVRDIETKYGKAHPSIHDIMWHKDTNLSFMTHVNSLHHQCIEYYGEAFSFSLLATEPITGTAEAVLWSNMFLGVQFHPELLRDTNPDKAKFALAIEKWVNDESGVLNSKNRTLRGKLSYGSSATYNWTTEGDS